MSTNILSLLGKLKRQASWTCVLYLDNYLVACATTDGYLQLYDVREDQLLFSSQFHEGAIFQLQTSGGRLFSAGFDGKIKLYSWKQGQLKYLSQLSPQLGGELRQFSVGQQLVIVNQQERSMLLDLQHKTSCELPLTGYGLLAPDDQHLYQSSAGSGYLFKVSSQPILGIEQLIKIGTANTQQSWPCFEGQGQTFAWLETMHGGTSRRQTVQLLKQESSGWTHLPGPTLILAAGGDELHDYLLPQSDHDGIANLTFYDPYRLFYNIQTTQPDLCRSTLISVDQPGQHLLNLSASQLVASFGVQVSGKLLRIDSEQTIYFYHLQL